MFVQKATFALITSVLFLLSSCTFPKHSVRIGDVLSSSTADYTILQSLGSGVYGEVVKCINLNTKKTVAVKILKNLQNAFKEAQQEVLSD